MSSGHDVSEYEFGSTTCTSGLPSTDGVISIFAGCLTNHDLVHSQEQHVFGTSGEDEYSGV